MGNIVAAIEDNLDKYKNNLDNQINNYQNAINKIEKEYESLREFKQMVYRAQSDFATVNNRRKLVLTDLNSIDNTVVKKYREGMGKSLTGIGANVAGAAFWGLLASIDLKMARYQTQLVGLNLEKTKLQADLKVANLVNL